ncbi:CoA-binding protein [Lutibacter citreus]|uniref:CoA-binding protein n=1 Tax=Lutibacter citreus TaxID=2138210 RepID=UPI000DBE81C0|nr:CoA-binding protein [Lutibacter citreus]
MEKKTLVLGASINPNRYSNIAIKRLVDNAVEVCAVGNRKGVVSGISIFTSKEDFKNIHTITLYLNKNNQVEYYNYILKLQPERVIFNPGTENKELENLLRENKISFEHSCTLVLLSLDQY